MKKLFFIMIMSLVSLASPAQIMKFGDLNHDNQVNVTDVMTLVDIVLHGYSPFSVSPTEVTLQAGGSATLTIDGGYYYYEAVPADPNVVEASVFGATVTLKAVGGGETTVTVKDVLTFRTIDISVVVENNALQLSTNELLLIVGEQGTVDVTSGSGNYSVESSDEGVATAVIDGNSIIVTAVGGGKATITVNDAKSGQMCTINVKVNAAPVSHLTCPDDNHPHMIELGLPSGTKWACCNVDAMKPEEYGGYYAWGETHAKDYYDWSSYTHCDGSLYTCHDLGTDIAGTQFDVAYVQWDGSWVMPSFNQIQELVNNCSYSWTSINGVNGGQFIGPSGGVIFLPAAGYRTGEIIYDTGGQGTYWSSTHASPPSPLYCAYDLYFKSRDTGWRRETRDDGKPVRPVYIGNTIEPLTLFTSRVEIIVGEVTTVEITSGNNSYTVVNSNNNVATTSLSDNIITVTGVAAGSSTVTVTDVLTNDSQEINITVYRTCPDDNHPHMIDLGLPSGTKWACCNVDTENPEKQSPTNYGGHYAWGEIEEKEVYTWETYVHIIDSYHTPDSYYNCDDIGDDIAGTMYDVAHMKWGSEWQMPTYDQIKELGYCTTKWTTVNGVNGRIFKGRNGSRIFMPAAGYLNDSEPSNAGSVGHYWTSMPYSNYGFKALYLYFECISTYTIDDYADIYRYFGLSVRPVVRN